MAFDNDKTKEANIELENRIEKDRDEWKNKIASLINKIRNMNELSECQALMLSYRQIMLDKISDFKSIIFKRNAAQDRYYKEMYKKYTLNYDIRLTSGEKNKFIQADLSALIYQIKLLENHVEYYQGCIKTLDNTAFAIRNRIRLDDETQ